MVESPAAKSVDGALLLPSSSAAVRSLKAASAVVFVHLSVGQTHRSTSRRTVRASHGGEERRINRSVSSDAVKVKRVASATANAQLQPPCQWTPLKFRLVFRPVASSASRPPFPLTGTEKRRE